MVSRFVSWLAGYPRCRRLIASTQLSLKNMITTTQIPKMNGMHRMSFQLPGHRTCSYSNSCRSLLGLHLSDVAAQRQPFRYALVCIAKYAKLARGQSRSRCMQRGPHGTLPRCVAHGTSHAHRQLVFRSVESALRYLVFSIYRQLRSTTRAGMQRPRSGPRLLRMLVVMDQFSLTERTT